MRPRRCGTILSRGGTIQDMSNKLDKVATTLAENVNTIHSAGYSSTGVTGLDFFVSGDDDPLSAANIVVNRELMSDVNKVAVSSGDPAMRRALWEGGLPAVQASTDPLIQFLLKIQDVTRATRTEYEGKVQAPTDRASEALAKASVSPFLDQARLVHRTVSMEKKSLNVVANPRVVQSAGGA